MLQEFACPVCDSDRWRTLDRFVYVAVDKSRVSRSANRRRQVARVLEQASHVWHAVVHGKPKPVKPGTRPLSDYERLRRRVLFEVWAPGKTSASVTSRVCLECGFGAYAPRPEAEDIRAKYEFLTREESKALQVVFAERRHSCRSGRNEPSVD